MFKSLVALAMIGAISGPAVSQPEPAANPAPVAKPQTVKKRVCYQDEEDSYSRLGGRKICKTVEVPVQTPPANGSQNSQAPAASSPNGNNL